VGRKDKVVATLRGGLEKTCARLRIRRVKGRGKIIDASLVKVTDDEGRIEDIEGDRVIIATGSGPLALPSLPVDHKRILDSDDALNMDCVPSSLIIVGGGVVGAELAFIFRTFGSEVTVIEGLSRILPVPSVDVEMSKLLQREMKKADIGLELCRVVTEARPAGNRVDVVLGPSPFLPPESLPQAARQESKIAVQAVIVAAGRAPDTGGLGLEDAGIATDGHGYILADEFLQTNMPGIYALGDVLGPSKIMLAHMAAFEGNIAAENCLGAKKSVNYAVVPSGIFTSPEISDVGLTESQAMEKGYNVACTLFQFRELGKAQAMGALPGVFKLVADKSSGKLLGAHIAGAHATDIIAEAALALQMGAGVKDVVNTIHAHPTLAEGFFEAARLL
jgi:dihydrolipoamide dehydrogenase